MNNIIRHKEATIPTVLGLFVAILGLASGIFLLRGQLNLRSTASADEAPNSVRVTNVSDTGFTVSWYTDKALAGFVQYGETGRESDLVVSDERDQQKGEVANYFTHFVTVRGLRPDSSYDFKIGSGRGIYDNNGQVYQVTTGPVIANQPAADVAYGMVVSASGDPAEGAIVYLEIDGGQPQAALVKSSGSWVIPLSTTRTIDLRRYITYDRETAPVRLVIQGSTLGVSNVKTDTANDSPVPQVTLGRDVTFPEGEVSNQNTNTTRTANLNVATESASLKILTPSTGLPIDNQEIIIAGEAPPGARVDIEIHSDEVIIGTAQADSQGKFSFDVPQNLTPGQHTVTLSTIVNGVVETITRSFTVYAAEESGIPFYTATPSGTIVPSPTVAVPTATPIISPTVTTTITPTVPPRVTNPSTESAIIKTGNEWMTWLLLGAGIVFVTSGAWWYRKSN